MLETEATRAALAASGLIDELGERADELLDCVEELHLGGGELVFAEGDDADALYVVLDGAVQVLGAGRDGRELVLRRVGPMTAFGEQAVMPGARRRRTASVRTAEPTVLLRLGRGDYLAHVDTGYAIHRRLAELGERNVREQLLRHSQLVAALDLRADARQRTIGPGEVLFREGAEADCVYLIVRGSAAVYREQGGHPVLLSRIEAGRTVGEMAFVRRSRRSATVVAESELRVLEIEGTRFLELLEASPDLREHVRALEAVYQLPARGFVTQHSGRVLGEDALTTIYHLSDGRRFAVSRVIDGALYHLERLEPPPPDDATAIEHDGVALHITPAGEIVEITARGEWRDLAAAHLLAIDGTPLSDHQRSAFGATGELPIERAEDVAERDDPDAVLCTCVHVLQGTVDEAIGDGCTSVEGLQRALGCATVCGGCIPRLAERLGEAAWTPVEIADEIPLTPTVRAFRLRPLAGHVRPWRPGQHVVISALIDGHWIERSYTLSGARDDQVYEITVKREKQGLFSRWLFDERSADAQLRVSRPLGDVLWVTDAPMLCFVAGIGVTPAIAACRARSNGSPVHIDYCGRSAQELAYLEELMSAEGVELAVRETGTTNRISAPEVAELVARTPGAEAFVCGPEGYLLDVTSFLQQAGVSSERIHIEVFTHAAGVVAAAPDAEVAGAGYLFTAPEPQQASPWARALTGAARAAYRLANTHLQPTRLLSDRIAASAGLDPALPRVHLGAVGALALGPRDSTIEPAKRFHTAYAANRRRAAEARARGQAVDPRTPDGQTWGYWLPNAPLVEFEGPMAVQTGWTKAAPGGMFMPAIVTKQPHAVAHLMATAEYADRGPLPNHYLAQLVGIPNRPPESNSTPLGLFAGRFRSNETWANDRETAASAFGPAVLHTLIPALETSLATVLEQIDAWLEEHAGEVVDGHDLMMRIAYDMVIRATIGNADIAELHDIGDEIRRPIRAGLGALFATMNGQRSRASELMQNASDMHAAFDRLIDVVQQRHAEGGLTAGQLRSPIVHAIVVGDSSGTPIPKDRLGALLGPIIVAGHETTGHTLAWSLWQLGRNPGLRSLIVDEIDLFARNHRGRTIRPELYDERPWTQALLYEIWRCYPPIPGIARMTISDGDVPADPATGIGSFRYRRDTLVIGSIVAIHLDPDRYPQPFEFRPERWMTGVSAAMSVREQGKVVRENSAAREEAHELLTFGTGPGRCLGRAFNMLESIVVLDGILSRFTVDLADPYSDVPMSDAALAGPEAGRIGVRLQRRAAVGA